MIPRSTVAIHPEDASEIHPWDTGERPALALRILWLPFFLIVQIPLLILRLGIIAMTAGLIMFTLAACRGPLHCLLEPALSVAGRLCLLGFGVWPMCLKIRRASSGGTSDASVVVVAPHIGMLDAFFFLYNGFPRPMSLEPYTKIPVVGRLFRAANGIAVPLPKATRRTKLHVSNGAHECDSDAAPSMKEKATNAARQAILEHKKQWTSSGGSRRERKPILILPEGTTHNGRSLLRFFTGAFEGGGPVQPVLIKYPYCIVNAAFFNDKLPEHMFRLLTAPWVRMEVTYMPVYHPSPEECADADLYAANVRSSMAMAASLPLSSYNAKQLRREVRDTAIRRSTPHTPGT